MYFIFVKFKNLIEAINQKIIILNELSLQRPTEFLHWESLLSPPKQKVNIQIFNILTSFLNHVLILAL